MERLGGPDACLVTKAKAGGQRDYLMLSERRARTQSQNPDGATVPHKGSVTPTKFVKRMIPHMGASGPSRGTLLFTVASDGCLGTPP